MVSYICRICLLLCVCIWFCAQECMLSYVYVCLRPCTEWNDKLLLYLVPCWTLVSYICFWFCLCSRMVKKFHACFGSVSWDCNALSFRPSAVVFVVSCTCHHPDPPPLTPDPPDLTWSLDGCCSIVTWWYDGGGAWPLPWPSVLVVLFLSTFYWAKESWSDTNGTSEWKSPLCQARRFCVRFPLPRWS